MTFGLFYFGMFINVLIFMEFIHFKCSIGCMFFLHIFLLLHPLVSNTVNALTHSVLFTLIIFLSFTSIFTLYSRFLVFVDWMISVSLILEKNYKTTLDVDENLTCNKIAKQGNSILVIKCWS